MEQSISNLFTNPFFVGFLVGMLTHWYMNNKTQKSQNPSHGGNITTLRK